ncbi:MAG TPA: S26 family signal peptidase [Actinomycetota bacterium]
MRRGGALPVLAAVAGWLAWRRPFRVVVEGVSMASALRPGDQLLCVRRRRIRRGDVVVVRPPSHDVEMVKRVTGLPGDPMGARTLGEDEYQVEGDDPLRSTDGRSFGPVARRDILGVAVLRYLPDPRLL